MLGELHYSVLFLSLDLQFHEFRQYLKMVSKAVTKQTRLVLVGKISNRKG